MSVQGKRTVSLEVAGRTYRIATTGSEEELRRLAAVVDSRTQELFRGRQMSADGVVLTAITLAHDAEAERDRGAAFRARVREVMGELLMEIDVALAQLGRVGDKPDE